MSCADLAKFALPDAHVVSASEVREPFAVPPSGGTQTITVSAPFAFCRVDVRLTPSADSDIHAEVWLPAPERWNGRFLGVGNGGLSGAIWYTSMVRPLQRGYAVAGSDLGHIAPNMDWARDHQEKLTDYAHRADHVTSIVAKALIAARYGQSQRFSYFHGCSNGGHQALMEAQRYPEDYNGIIAGAPWNSWTRQIVDFAWRAQHLQYVDRTKLPLITKAVVAQCGVHDGGAAGDAYLNDPRLCKFDPKVLLCKGPAGPTCLIQQEVDAVRKIYEGPTDAPGGKRLYPGFERGSESGWSDSVGTFTTNMFQSVVYPGNSAWDFKAFDFKRDADAINSTLADLINSNKTDMRAFRARGGKLLMWHGWADPLLEPRESVLYYNRVVAAAQADGKADERAKLADTQAFFRLYMAPGVNHCRGGEGPDSTFAYTLASAEDAVDPEHDALSALERWVESDVAPNTLVSAHTADGKVDRRRPLCVYPKVSRFSGRGDASAPESWTCVDDWDGFKRDYTEAAK